MNNIHFAKEDVKEFLDLKSEQYNQHFFIELDPISIPHQFSLKEDIEISGFLTASIAWGNRKIILKNAHRLIVIMGESPFDFVMQATESQISKINFVHRTFNSEDLGCFIRGLRNVYERHGGMQRVFEQNAKEDSLQPAISAFKHLFFQIDHLERTRKHLSDPLQGSAAKRINMMLRWFIRKDKNGVDLGIWNGVLRPSQLSLPLDVHSGSIARKLGLLKRTQNDAKAVSEIDQVLRSFDPLDPVKYDFALFGLGAFESVNKRKITKSIFF
jgi:uncharacterized protein (TIGR02757 family)